MDNPLDLIFGTKPEVEPYTPTDFGVEQIKALKENIAAMPWITELGDLYQTYMTNAMNKEIPGFSDILAMGGKLTQKMQGIAEEELSGQIPQDVQDALQRSSAFQNLLSGGGGGMASANTARNYGLTSLDMISRGEKTQEVAGNAAQRWAGLASGMIMGPSGFLITPKQQAELTMQNNLYRQATKQLEHNVEAAPDPTWKGLSDIVENLTAAYLGGKVGTIGAGNAQATSAATPLVSTSGGYSSGGQMNTGFPAEGYSKDVSAASSFNNDVGVAGYNYNATPTGYDYGAGYPTANPSGYYGGNNPYADTLYSQGFQIGAFGG